MKEGDLITPEYLYEFGIKIVYQNLVENGYKVLNVRMEPEVNPQILAEKDAQKVMVVVRTDFYPRVGLVPDNILWNKLLKLAEKMGTELKLARVGIGRGDVEDEAEKSRPLVGGTHLIMYGGLE